MASVGSGNGHMMRNLPGGKDRAGSKAMSVESSQLEELEETSSFRDLLGSEKTLSETQPMESASGRFASTFSSSRKPNGHREGMLINGGGGSLKTRNHSVGVMSSASKSLVAQNNGKSLDRGQLQTSTSLDLESATMSARKERERDHIIDSITIPRERVQTETVDNKHFTVFVLEIKLSNSLCWTKRKRYNDFRLLHEGLKRSTNLVRNWNFPKKHMFSSRNEKVIEERRQAFDEYMKFLVQHQVHTTVKNALYDFLNVREILRTSPQVQYQSTSSQPQSSSSFLQSKTICIPSTIYKELLAPEEIADLEAAFKRLCLSKGYVFPKNEAGEITAYAITKNSFRREILGVYPSIPSAFVLRMAKAVNDKAKKDVAMEDLLSLIGVLKRGTLEDQYKLMFLLCDADHNNRIQLTSLVSLVTVLNGRWFVERSDVMNQANLLFENGRGRLSCTEFVEGAVKHIGTELVEWMAGMAEKLIEEPNQAMLDYQELFNPVAQQKILAEETYFSTNGVSILQEAFSQLQEKSEGGGEVSLTALEEMFPLDVPKSMLKELFSSFGKRADGQTIDIFSFVSVLSIACRGKEEEKYHCCFTVLDQDKDGLFNRDDLFALLQQTLPNDLGIEEVIMSYINLEKTRMSEVQLSTEPEQKRFEILRSESISLSGSKVGLYVDHVLREHGDLLDGKYVLNEAQFSGWAKEINLQINFLNVMKEVVFVDLGMRPRTAREEKEVIELCWRSFPGEDDMDLLNEGDEWSIIDGKWWRSWADFAGFDLHKKKERANTDEGRSLIEMSFTMFKSGDKEAKKEESKNGSPNNKVRPRYVSNTGLLADNNGEKRKLKSTDLKLGEDFYIIWCRVWVALKAWYGGGPDITRTVISLKNGDPYIDIYGTGPPPDIGRGLDNKEEDFALEDRKTTRESSFAHRPSAGTNSLKKKHVGGLVGLTNLGNTCYLNSALQCLSNTALLNEYFTSAGYLPDINRTNTMGMQGKLAEVYGKLMTEMWTTKTKAISPRKLKATLGKFSETFRGNDQQDAQEFLSLLLSGLSEDLNRIYDKPYIEQPDSDGRTDAELADEWWQNHLRREVSIIVALFTGQFKSLLVCCQCNYRSARFEPFSFLQVPLPEPKHQNVTLRIILDSGAAPTDVSLRLSLNATVAELKEKLLELLNLDYNLIGLQAEDLLIAEVNNQTIASFKTDLRKITTIRSIDRLFAYQLPALSQLRRELPPETIVPDVQAMYSPYAPSSSSQKRSNSQAMPSPQQNGGVEKTPLKAGAMAEVYSKSRDDYLPCLAYKQHEDLSYSLMMSANKVFHRAPHYHVRPRRPRLRHVCLISRKLGYVLIYFKNPFRPVPFGTPELLRFVPECTTGLELYEMVWTRVKRYAGTSPPTKLDEQSVFGGTPSCTIDSIAVNIPSCGFRLRRVDQTGLACARCPWLDRCFGCEIPCNGELVDLIDDEMIAIDWGMEVLQNNFQHEESKRVEKHPSIEKNENLDKGPVPLHRCLQVFTKEERIAEGYCSNCKQHQECTKRLDIWRLPPILVIHLKRFQYTPTYRRKLNALVEFPIRGLDLSPFLADWDPANHVPYPVKDEDKAKKKTSEPNSANGTTESSRASAFRRRGYTGSELDTENSRPSPIYDLYGVVNHRGALGGGHYTAYAKHSVDGQWYSFDDERVRIVEEDKVVTAAAYLLFYIRRDVVGAEISDVYPATSAGMPVTDADIEKIVEQRDGKCSIM